MLAALQAPLARPDLSAEAHDVVRRNLEEYFTDNADRLDYPRFVARQLPIGSGAVESGCKQLISKRAKGAGMRWTPQGAQAIANLRALHQSGHGRWAMFWASRPLTRLRALPAADALPGLWPAVDAAPAPAPTDPTPADSAAPPIAPQRIVSTGKPWGKGKGYWGRVAVSHRRSA